MRQLIAQKFKFKTRQTTFKKELIGGVITFCAMLYILPVNSGILSNEQTGIPFGGVYIATALVSAVGSIAMGLIANLPIGVATGMGSNIFFVNTLIIQFNLPWKIAFSIVLINGLVFTLLASLGIISKFIIILPQAIKTGMICSLGLYLTYIGLQNANLVIIKDNTIMLGDLKNISVILTWCGIILIFALTLRKLKMAILITIIIMAIIGMLVGSVIPDAQSQNLSTIFDITFNYQYLSQFPEIAGQGILNIPEALKLPETYIGLFALAFMTLSVASGTIVSVGEMAKLKDQNNQILGTKKALMTIGGSSILAGSLGTSPAGSFLESHAGVAYGAKTGLAAIIVGLLFILSIPLFPILEPLFNHNFVTCPVLVLVGCSMTKNIGQVKWNDLNQSLSVFMLLIMTLFSFSILNGIAFGLVFYVLSNLISKNYRQLNYQIIICALLFLGYIITYPLLFTT